MSRILSPSFLSADFANLQRDIEMMNDSRARWFHLDIMDGVFVPNLSYGLPVVEAIRRHTKKVLDVHLMIVEPDRYITRFRDAGADWLSVHVEATPHLHRTLQAIRDAGMKAGAALNPHTPLCAVEEVLGDLDLVLLMSVNPGFGGQRFIEGAVDKTRRLKEMLLERGSSALIEVDGGVNLHNARPLFDAGADVLVAGSSVFKNDDPADMVDRLLNV